MKKILILAVAFGAATSARADLPTAILFGNLGITNYQSANAATPNSSYTDAITFLAAAVNVANLGGPANADIAHVLANYAYINGSYAATLTGNAQAGSAIVFNAAMMGQLLGLIPQLAPGTLLAPQANAALAAAATGLGYMQAITGPAVADPVLTSAFQFEMVGFARINQGIANSSPATFADAYGLYLNTAIKMSDIATRYQNFEAFHAANWQIVALNRLEECVTGIVH